MLRQGPVHETGVDRRRSKIIISLEVRFISTKSGLIALLLAFKRSIMEFLCYRSIDWVLWVSRPIGYI